MEAYHARIKQNIKKKPSLTRFISKYLFYNTIDFIFFFIFNFCSIFFLERIKQLCILSWTKLISLKHNIDNNYSKKLKILNKKKQLNSYWDLLDSGKRTTNDIVKLCANLNTSEIVYSENCSESNNGCDSEKNNCKYEVVQNDACDVTKNDNSKKIIFCFLLS